jgi:integrase
MHGRSREMGLGSANVYGLAEARERNRRYQQQIDDGVDPIEQRKIERAAAAAERAKLVTFAEAAGGYINDNRSGWRSAVHARQWAQSLRDHVFPAIGSLPAGAIETGHIVKLLRPLWEAKPETAKRVQGRIAAILDWSAAQGFRQGENPARWRGHLQNILPRKDKLTTVKHNKALPIDGVPAFFAQLTKTEGTAARALEMIVLTAARVDEALNATWGEIDLTEAVWTLPAVSESNRRGRTKNGREHRVPLSPRLLAMLTALPSNREPSAPVFKVGRTTLRDLMKRLVPGNTPTIHGLRSTFRTWCGEYQPDAARVTAEAALGHSKGDKLEAAYDRGDKLAKRRTLMEAWARFCAGAR